MHLAHLGSSRHTLSHLSRLSGNFCMFAWLVWIAFCVAYMVAWHSYMAYMTLDFFIIILFFLFFIFFIFFYHFLKHHFIHLFKLIILCFCREPNQLEKEESPWAWDDTKDAIFKMVEYQIWLACENEGFWKIPDCVLTWKGVGFNFGGLLVRFTKRHAKRKFLWIGRGVGLCGA